MMTIITNYIIIIFICVLILLFLIWMYFGFDYILQTNTVIYRTHKEDNLVYKTIKWLYKTIDHICTYCQMYPIYNIVEAHNITYTEIERKRSKDAKNHPKGTIYLVLWDDKKRLLFDDNTLIYAMLHEIAHIMSPSHYHEYPFDKIENKLLNTAALLGYYDTTKLLDINYRTIG